MKPFSPESCLELKSPHILVETISEEGSHWYHGVAASKDLVITSTDLALSNFMKIYVYVVSEGKRTQFPVQRFNLHTSDDFVEIRIDGTFSESLIRELN
jgi:hypothetical protein